MLSLMHRESTVGLLETKKKSLTVGNNIGIGIEELPMTKFVIHARMNHGNFALGRTEVILPFRRLPLRGRVASVYGRCKKGEEMRVRSDAKCVPWVWLARCSLLSSLSLSLLSLEIRLRFRAIYNSARPPAGPG